MTSQGSVQVGTVRRAGERDLPDLLRLRRIMLTAMGESVDQPDWPELVGGWFRTQLTRPNQFAAFLTEDAEIGVAACAIGTIDHHVPSTRNPSGQIGYVFNVSTDPRARRRGYARAATEALLARYDRPTEVGLI